MTRLNLSTEITLSHQDLDRLDLSIPCWNELAQMPANLGFVRHDVDKAVDHVGAERKPTYTEHVQAYLAATGQLPAPSPQTIVAVISA